MLSGGTEMVVTLMALFAAILLAAVLVKRARDRRELERYSITAEALHALLTSNQDVLLFDVRQPLDLLGHRVIIPGAKWLAPREVLENPLLIPKEKDVVVYCTCPSAKTSRAILRRALAKGFLRTKFLEGGLEGWRTRGFPVEPYEMPFHLDSSGGTRLPIAS
jgi:rhodanese-related sulfurtransferase